MPVYTYRCPMYHLTEIVAPISNIPADVPCKECGRPTKRLWIMPGVNWGGVKPHQEHRARPKWLQERFDREDENRDKYRQKKADRGE